MTQRAKSLTRCTISEIQIVLCNIRPVILAGSLSTWLIMCG